jgi:hypothetical protein
VAESARVGIARVVGRLVERLRAVVVGKLEDAFTFVTVCFFLDICSFAARLIKGEEVKRKVTKFELYSRFRMSDEPLVR